MSKSTFIVTGTSRGLGNSIAKMLLEDGHTVTGISREAASDLAEYSLYTHEKTDLSEIGIIDPLIKGITSRINEKEYDSIQLINNAAVIEPLKRIQECSSDEIIFSIHVNLVAPMILTSSFIKHTSIFNLKRKVINISSGSGTYPNPSMSIYSTAKAGINMFTQCVGMEQSREGTPVEVIGFDPGMIETDMQKIARNKENNQFELADLFYEAKLNGQVKSKYEAAKKLKKVIDMDNEIGKIYS